ncbi:hypothetical protein [Paraliomyxa miuraensis]|uniref:hypothetical protein n=1 Tax=Paraliomyxa miuraensis TaxID=376150 RepID=UPI00224C7C87|nr:hypothetical protein [Paraliomyxa miuraensis]MCX4246395.1 hypothetical protein [Paraliomyxa miuraensis]
MRSTVIDGPDMWMPFDFSQDGVAPMALNDPEAVAACASRMIHDGVEPKDDVGVA